MNDSRHIGCYECIPRHLCGAICSKAEDCTKKEAGYNDFSCVGPTVSQIGDDIHPWHGLMTTQAAPEKIKSRADLPTSALFTALFKCTRLKSLGSPDFTCECNAASG